MFRYKNEAEFSRAFCKQLTKNGWFVQRIETGSIGRGVPDIYAVSPMKQAVWFELKRVHMKIYTNNPVYIPWRAGQQAWLHGITIYGQNAFTMACFDNMILQIPHNFTYPDNMVHPLSVYNHFRIGDIK